MSNRFYTILNLITGVVTVITQFAIGFFLSPFIVNTLGTEANGYTQLAANFVMYVSLITTAFNSMASRFVTIAYHQGRIEKAREYYSSIYVTNIWLIILLLPITVLVTWKLENAIVIENIDVDDVKVLFGCVFANFFVGMLSSLYSIAMYVKNAIFYSNILNCIRTICNAVLLFVVFSLLPIKVFYVSFVALVLGVVLLPIYIRIQNKLIPNISFKRESFSVKAVKDMFISGIWNSVNQCGHLLLTGLDLLLSNWLISPYVMGMIAVSKTIPTAIIQLATTINTNFSPSLTQNWAKGDFGSVMHELRMAIKISIVIVSIPIVTFCCLGIDFYKLWQPTLNSVELTILSALACCSFMIFAGTQVLYNVLTASNHLKLNSVTFILFGVLNVLCVYWGVEVYPEYGMYIIVGVSSLLIIIRQLIIMLPYTAKLLNQHWSIFYKDILLTLVCCIVNSVLAIAIMKLCPVHGWITLITDGVLIVVVAVPIECYLLMTKMERNKVLQIIKKKL